MTDRSRRRVLAGLAGGFASGLSGCLSSAGGISVNGSSLPVDVDRVWERTLGLLAPEDVDPPGVVRVREGPLTAWGPHGFAAKVSGHERQSVERPAPAGQFDLGDPPTVTVVPGDASPAEIELRLVQEFVNVAILDSWLGKTLAGSAGGSDALQCLLRGSPVHVATAYADRYLDGTPSPAERYRSAPPELAFEWADHYHGQRYFDRRLDPPEELSTVPLSVVYRDPPRTTADVLHAPPRTDGPALLDVTAESGKEWVATSLHRPTYGELFVRVLLGIHLPADRAAEAAAGWANDVEVPFSEGFADANEWILRWDDAAAANTFETALEAFLDRRAPRAGDTWHAEDEELAFSIHRAGEDVVGLAVGPSGFAENVAVTADGGDVTVTGG